MSSQEKIQCSVPLLTLNSAVHLAQCLESVRDFGDVFLLDGNSTDRTLDIARRHSIPVYKQQDTDEPNVAIASFTDMRLKAEKLSRCDWILYLDSDEFISPELADEIRLSLSSNDPKRIFIVHKIAIMGKRVVRHSFNTPTYVPHLYHRRSGVAWKPGKLVHEKLTIPKDAREVQLRGAIYSYMTPSYREALTKDNYYLSLTRQKMIAPGQAVAVRPTFTSLWVNFLRAGNILCKSLAVYLRHGFKESLPPLHVWRYVRYHLVICTYCVRKLWAARARRGARRTT